MTVTSFRQAMARTKLGIAADSPSLGVVGCKAWEGRLPLACGGGEKGGRCERRGLSMADQGCCGAAEQPQWDPASPHLIRQRGPCLELQPPMLRHLQPEQLILSLQGLDLGLHLSNAAARPLCLRCTSEDGVCWSGASASAQFGLGARVPACRQPPRAYTYRWAGGLDLTATVLAGWLAGWRAGGLAGGWSRGESHYEEPHTRYGQAHARRPSTPHLVATASR